MAPDAHPMIEEYLGRRSANRAIWADRVRRHGTELLATNSTAWVRAGTLRRLRPVVRPSDRVLEVGCGNGNLLGPLAARAQAFGVDLTMEMLSVAKRHERAIRAVTCGDAAWLPFRTGSFDVVYTSRCLINVQDRDMQATALREILRVVKRHGTVVLSENFTEPVDRLNNARIRFRAGPPATDAENLRLNLDDTLRLCRECGWVPVRIQGYSLAAFMSEIFIARLTQVRGGRILHRLLSPLVAGAARLDDVASGWLPQFGKDTTITLTSSSADGR